MDIHPDRAFAFAEIYANGSKAPRAVVLSIAAVAGEADLVAAVVYKTADGADATRWRSIVLLSDDTIVLSELVGDRRDWDYDDGDGPNVRPVGATLVRRLTDVDSVILDNPIVTEMVSGRRPWGLTGTWVLHWSNGARLELTPPQPSDQPNIDAIEAIVRKARQILVG